MHTTTRVRAAACRGPRQQRPAVVVRDARPAVVRTRAYLEEKQPGAGQTAQGSNQLEGN